MDANRLQTLFSEYERVISEQTEPRRRSVSAHQENRNLEPHCPKSQHQALSEAITNCEQSGVTQPRRSQRKRKVAPRPATTASNRFQKKRIATCSSQEYEFLRLGEVRKAWNGSIEYKVIWKPTWAYIDDLRGKRALEEAEELIVDEFGQVAWEKEMARSGHFDLDTESE
ncbi:hypothetical protein HRG_007143 [Hirsutella rhossiliensis]|uniref:Chromo domain-containing protein n=1 Tax=Hirsutella rhossiliensis TaxID=111463 RepID=A0A9P8MTZ9_9HYPO|nr:uncharacterized protein HRG_07143 [Hirsutella rhossiliensis]KAH0962063.1 hypothetical protein HRG_07143 [Hirsutella rhossiliensis]